jgi:hypothetical protein
MTDGERKVLKPKAVFRDTGKAYARKRRRGYRAMGGACLRYMAGWPQPSREFATEFPRAKLFRPHEVSSEFFGMNLCPSPDPTGDAIQIGALHQLGVRAVRLDYGTQADRAPADRLIDSLVSEGLRTTLHLVQDPAEASTMDAPDTQAQWRRFLDDTLERHGGAIEALEVGSTPNRHSWSGYTPIDYAIAARIAQEALDKAYGDAYDRPLLLGPNISDFAPYFNIGQLAQCRRQAVEFDVATDNLFFDRVGEPEAYDRHATGKLLRFVGRLDMVRKQRVLADIARRFEIPRIWCTYTHYTLNFGKTRRRYVSSEEYANYMVRSHILTAAAGAFERFYWGTLVTHFKGLIDEGLGVRPYPPFVHHRFAVDAPPSEWKRRRRFFNTYATMTDHLRGASFIRKWKTVSSKAIVLEFRAPKGRVVVGWARDGSSPTTALAMPETHQMPQRLLDREGRQLTIQPRIILSAAPRYWLF